MIKLYLSLLLLFCSGLQARSQLLPCGSGADGAYHATSNTTLAGGTYNFSSFTIDPSVQVIVTGPSPLIIMSTGNVQIDGILRASGAGGGDGVTFSAGGAGAIGVAGGGSGGSGSFSAGTGPLNGINGAGSGSGGMGAGWSGGGGAGYASGGQSSGGVGGSGGPTYGDAPITVLDAGSGGGGGSGGYDCGAGGGGAGGGIIQIASCGTLTIGATGSVLSNGGNGGTDGTGNCGGGGAGSGGVVWMSANSLVVNGSIQAVGGLGGGSAIPGNPYFGVGGNGAEGRIRFDYGTIGGAGSVNPSAFVGTALSISLVSFDAEANGFNNMISASFNVDNDEVKATLQHSTDGQSFSDLKSWNISKSETVDFIHTVSSGWHYYRVAYQAISGGQKFTPVRVLHNDGGNYSTTLYPNPVTNDQLSVNYHAATSDALIISIADVSGKTVFVWSGPVSAGSNKIDLNLAGIADGFYLLRIADGSGHAGVHRVQVAHGR